jgi:hypothetical protein
MCNPETVVQAVPELDEPCSTRRIGMSTQSIVQRSARRLAVTVAVATCAAALVPVSAAPASSAVKKPPKKIVATGTIPPSPAPNFGTALPDGSLPFTATYQMDGDLTGEVSGKGTMSLPTGGTFVQHKTVGKFVGTLAGVGRVRLTFLTTVPESRIDATSFTESGTAHATSGKIKGYKGTIANKISGPGDLGGTYRVKLQRPR